jgi:hypothetical protein
MIFMGRLKYLLGFMEIFQGITGYHFTLLNTSKINVISMSVLSTVTRVED